MARPHHLRAVQRQQRDAVDPIQYYNKHHNALLQRHEFSSEHDKHDIHDNIHTTHIPRQLPARQIRKLSEISSNSTSMFSHCYIIYDQFLKRNGENYDCVAIISKMLLLTSNIRYTCGTVLEELIISFLIHDLSRETRRCRSHFNNFNNHHFNNRRTRVKRELWWF